jgi:penicillin-insensitive murein endopeptidase
MRAVACLLAVLFHAAAGSAVAQEKRLIDPMLPGSLNPKPLPPLKTRTRRRRRPRSCSRANQRRFPGRRARSAAISTAASPAPCAADHWTYLASHAVSRNRNWGNPQLFASSNGLPERKKVGWNGLWLATCRSRAAADALRHTSHQVGLDVDIWFMPMPNHVQSREEREFGSATDVVAPDLLDVDPEVWTHRHTALIRTAAQDPAVVAS